jgi:hypothetical protein
MLKRSDSVGCGVLSSFSQQANADFFKPRSSHAAVAILGLAGYAAAMNIADL